MIFLIALRDQHNFEYGIDKEANGVVINDKCKELARKVKEIIDTKSSFADWLNNQNVRNQLKLDVKICLVKNGYPPRYCPEVFIKVMEQVENFEEHAETTLGSKFDLFANSAPMSQSMLVEEDGASYSKKN